MGESQRNQQANRLNQDLMNLTSQVIGTNTDVSNRFDNYNLPFDYNQMSKIIDEITKGNIEQTNRLSDAQIQQGQSDLSERMASQGIAPSSIQESQAGNIRDVTNRKRYGLTQQLLTSALGQKRGAMSEENKNRFDITGAAQNVDFGNIANLMKKYGLTSNIMGQQMSNLGNLDNTTWFDDLLAIANTAANFMPGGGGGGGGGGAGGTLSDIRFKENIKKIGESSSGINIYEFNYKGGRKRYRGVIAQEVPEASFEIKGIKFVDYSKIDVDFEEI